MVISAVGSAAAVGGQHLPPLLESHHQGLPVLFVCVCVEEQIENEVKWRGKRKGERGGEGREERGREGREERGREREEGGKEREKRRE